MAGPFALAAAAPTSPERAPDPVEPALNLLFALPRLEPLLGTAKPAAPGAARPATSAQASRVPPAPPGVPEVSAPVLPRRPPAVASATRPTPSRGGAPMWLVAALSFLFLLGVSIASLMDLGGRLKELSFRQFGG